METVIVESTALVEQNPPDDAILFTVSGITAIVEQKFQFFSENFDVDLSKVGILKLIKL